MMNHQIQFLTRGFNELLERLEDNHEYLSEQVRANNLTIERRRELIGKVYKKQGQKLSIRT